MGITEESHGDQILGPDSPDVKRRKSGARLPLTPPAVSSALRELYLLSLTSSASSPETLSPTTSDSNVLPLVCNFIYYHRFISCTHRYAQRLQDFLNTNPSHSFDGFRNDTLLLQEILKNLNSLNTPVTINFKTITQHFSDMKAEIYHALKSSTTPPTRKLRNTLESSMSLLNKDFIKISEKFQTLIDEAILNNKATPNTDVDVESGIDHQDYFNTEANFEHYLSTSNDEASDASTIDPAPNTSVKRTLFDT